MQPIQAQDVYDTLCGNLMEEAQVSGVESAFRDGSVCDRRYEEMLAAYGRLRQRLGAGEEDTDIECIIDSLMTIQKELCLKMYDYGVKAGACAEHS